MLTIYLDSSYPETGAYTLTDWKQKELGNGEEAHDDGSERDGGVDMATGDAAEDLRKENMKSLSLEG